MKRLALYSAACILVLASAQASAGTMSFSGNRMGGGPPHGGPRHGGVSVDAIQSSFEEQLADITSAYDEGVAASEDYYSSDDYSDLVGKTEWLVDSYDWFVTGVERTIGRLDDYIASANDDLAFYDDLLADYEARDDLSETRLNRIVDWINAAQDMLTLQIETLTYKQTSLTEDLANFTTFQTDLTSYLDEIVTAGGGTLADDGDSAALRALAFGEAGGCGSLGAAPPTATVVPEPSAAAGLASAILTTIGWRALRRSSRLAA
ncbi:hypothetical protein [Lacipirellula parvula]|uniref:PEP-CTERM protein-sorting domain-containing protein n=1 Tax=Lacipirellula parvula TaxID=2650471 RepID=A0A5K7XAT0_9BACT|nr:hypothetical protein [Lacipirellula parvula]BBO33052.1 hypothetical protein PLANPX_2664 [Lacipirellula parvula]